MRQRLPMMEPTYLKIYCFQDLELLPSFSHSLQASFFYFTKVYLCFCLIKVRMLFYCNLDHFYRMPFRDLFLKQACSNLLAFSTLMLGGKKNRFVDFKLMPATFIPSTFIVLAFLTFAEATEETSCSP